MNLRVFPLVASMLLWGGACAAASSPTLVIMHANVVNVATGRVERDRSVVIKDGMTLDIRRSPGPPVPEATFVDATSKYLIPGLWDMHYHFNHSDPSPRELDLLIANGVLGIRDMGDQPDRIFPARSATASGDLLGPRIVACGPIVDGPEPTNPSISVSVHNAEEARAMAHTIKDMGADCIKVHEGVPLEAYLAIADEARKVDLPLVGHVPVRVRVPGLARWPGVIKPGTIVNNVMSNEDWLPTFLAAAGDPDLKEKLMKGTKAGDKTFKVHLDGYNFMPFFKGEQTKSPRREIFYFDDNASLNALRIDDWKLHFKIMEGNIATAQLKPLNMPEVINLRQDPFERFPSEAQMYFGWGATKLWLFVPAQAVVGQFIATFNEFPPSQKSGSFTVDQVLEQLQTTPATGK